MLILPWGEKRTKWGLSRIFFFSRFLSFIVFAISKSPQGNASAALQLAQLETEAGCHFCERATEERRENDAIIRKKVWVVKLGAFMKGGRLLQGSPAPRQMCLGVTPHLQLNESPDRCLTSGLGCHTRRTHKPCRDTQKHTVQFITHKGSGRGTLMWLWLTKITKQRFHSAYREVFAGCKTKQKKTVMSTNIHTAHWLKCSSAQTRWVSWNVSAAHRIFRLFLISGLYHPKTIRQYWKTGGILDNSAPQSSWFPFLLFFWWDLFIAEWSYFVKTHFHTWPKKQMWHLTTDVSFITSLLQGCLRSCFEAKMTKCHTTTINCQCRKTDVLNLCNVTLPCCTQHIATCQILLKNWKITVKQDWAEIQFHMFIINFFSWNRSCHLRWTTTQGFVWSSHRINDLVCCGFFFFFPKCLGTENQCVREERLKVRSF